MWLLQWHHLVYKTIQDIYRKGYVIILLLREQKTVHLNIYKKPFRPVSIDPLHRWVKQLFQSKNCKTKADIVFSQIPGSAGKA